VDFVHGTLDFKRTLEQRLACESQFAVSGSARGRISRSLRVALPAGRNLVEFGYKPVLFWRLLILQRVTFSASVAICCPQINRSLWLLSSFSGQRPASGLSRAALCVGLARNSQHCNLFRYPSRPGALCILSEVLRLGFGPRGIFFPDRRNIGLVG